MCTRNSLIYFCRLLCVSTGWWQVRVRVHVTVRVRDHASVRLRVHASVRVCVRFWAHVHVRVRIRARARAHVRARVSVSVYACVHVFVYVHLNACLRIGAANCQNCACTRAYPRKYTWIYRTYDYNIVSRNHCKVFCAMFQQTMDLGQSRENSLMFAQWRWTKQ